MLDATTNQAQQVTFDDQFDQVGGIPRGALEYPDYLTRILVADTDDLSTTLQPIARYYGQTSVSGVNVSLNFVLFEPGITLRGTPLAAQLGYPSVTVLQAFGDPNVSSVPGAITDFCSPLKTATNTFASVRTNPAADGTYTYVTFTQDQRDADGDGHENSLDSCPFTPNPNWDPRADKDANGETPGDRDSDRIPDECDPLPDDKGNPGVGAFNDHDGDTYLNAQDNCPLIANSLGAATSPFANEGDNNQADRDNDGIGDSCDLNPDTPDGLQTVKCFAETLTIGSGGTPSIDPDAIRNLQSFSPCGTDLGISDPSSGETPTPAPAPGDGGGTGGGTGGNGGIGGGPDSGIGSLSPGASSFPAWAAVLAAVAIAGILGGIYMLRTGPATNRRE
ncbi:MAG: thrombospondin type 3 repeat-containing protein [Chloroflexi bacterium]|nr:thrombospondin type 3 repeat-containing protein [Chloroflexota bacterium]